jgi:hypothetical protein
VQLNKHESRNKCVTFLYEFFKIVHSQAWQSFHHGHNANTPVAEPPLSPRILQEVLYCAEHAEAHAPPAPQATWMAVRTSSVHIKKSKVVTECNFGTEI